MSRTCLLFSTKVLSRTPSMYFMYYIGLVLLVCFSDKFWLALPLSPSFYSCLAFTPLFSNGSMSRTLLMFSSSFVSRNSYRCILLISRNDTMFSILHLSRTHYIVVVVRIIYSLVLEDWY